MSYIYYGTRTSTQFFLSIIYHESTKNTYKHKVIAKNQYFYMFGEGEVVIIIIIIIIIIKRINLLFYRKLNIHNEKIN